MNCFIDHNIGAAFMTNYKPIMLTFNEIVVHEYETIFSSLNSIFNYTHADRHQKKSCSHFFMGKEILIKMQCKMKKFNVTKIAFIYCFRKEFLFLSCS